MRLIDADALKETIEKIELSMTNKKTIIGIIDNAPAVNKCNNCDLMLKEKTKRYEK